MKQIELKCHQCNKLFKKPLKEYNRRIKNGVILFYCSNSCSAFHSNKNKKCKNIIKHCLFCKKEFLSTTKIKSKNCCSKNCAAKYSVSFNDFHLVKSEEYRKVYRETASIRTKNLWLDENYANKVFINLGKRRFTSKGEEEVRNYIIKNHMLDGWTFGIKKIDKKLCLIRDLYSDKLKTCVEYDGIWHFKDINGQLKEKQEKDKILEVWCKNNNYKLIRIKEDVYKTDRIGWLKRIENEIYYGKENLVKFY